jgi:hypothetical protein
MEYRWNEIDRGEPKYPGGELFSATLSTINPTLTGLADSFKTNCLAMAWARSVVTQTTKQQNLEGV